MIKMTGDGAGSLPAVNLMVPEKMHRIWRLSEIMLYFWNIYTAGWYVNVLFTAAGL